jgi:hypothetical protein
VKWAWIVSAQERLPAIRDHPVPGDERSFEADNQPVRIEIEPYPDLRAAPRNLYRGERLIEIIEIMDQW